jgi:hypothetical protein
LGPNFIGVASFDRALVVAVLMIIVALFAPQGIGGLFDYIHVRGRERLHLGGTA